MKNKHYIIPLFIPHLGCPHDCVFCNQKSITGSSYKIDGELVENTINEYLKTIKNENSTIEVSFFGGTFTAIPIPLQKELLNVAKRYKDEGLIDYIRMSTRPDYIDDDILRHLCEYTVDIIELGVQSLDREVLLKSGRGHDEDDVKNASRLIIQYGITLGHQMMLGLPGDSFEKDILTAQKIIEMRPEIVRIYPSLVIRNTPMEILYNRGEYKPYSLESAVEISKQIMGMFLANNIKVIRVGLQPTEEINIGGEFIDGPFHPAFRELVEGSAYNDMIFEILSKMNYKTVNISLNPKDISKLYANKKIFFNDMKRQININNIKIIQDENIVIGNFVIFNDECKINLSYFDYLIKKYKKGNNYLL